MRTMMADGGVHDDIVNKLWQVYSKSSDPQGGGADVSRCGSGYSQTPATRSYYHPWYAGFGETGSRDRESRCASEDRPRPAGHGNFFMLQTVEMLTRSG